MHFRFQDSSCNAFGFAFPIIFSNQSDPTNFASFSHSLRNIQSLYPRGIMYIQSRRNALKLDTNPPHTTRAKMRDESTCHWEPSFRGAEHGRRIIYVGRSHWPFALRRHFGARSERHTRPTAAEHSFGSCSGRAFFLPDVVGWVNLFNALRQYTAKITAFTRHFVSRTFENIELNSRTIEGT